MTRFPWVLIPMARIWRRFLRERHLVHLVHAKEGDRDGDLDGAGFRKSSPSELIHSLALQSSGTAHSVARRTQRTAGAEE